MRHKKLKLSILLLSGIGLAGLQAQTMLVKQSDGAQAAYALSAVRKITFSSGNLTIENADNSSGIYALNGLRYLNFTDHITNLDKQPDVKEQMLDAYPNPASNVINIDLTGTGQGEGTLRLFSLEGKTVFSRQVINKEILSLDISHLPKGIYLCQYTNATVAKTVKIIKK